MKNAHIGLLAGAVIVSAVPTPNTTSPGALVARHSNANNTLAQRGWIKKAKNGIAEGVVNDEKTDAAATLARLGPSSAPGAGGQGGMSSTSTPTGMVRRELGAPLPLDARDVEDTLAQRGWFKKAKNGIAEGTVSEEKAKAAATLARLGPSSTPGTGGQGGMDPTTGSTTTAMRRELAGSVA